MNNQPITTVLEVKPGEWRAIDAGSAAQWQNVITSQKELTESIREALRIVQRATAQAEVQQ
jgi:hypothetical protein